MLSAVKTYFKLAWHCKTPFIFLFDTKYKLTNITALANLYKEMPEIYYIPELRDCDDYAWIYKALASRAGINTVGLVIGKHHGLHCWNVAVCDNGIYQIEPQTGSIFQKRDNYKILGVII